MSWNETLREIQDKVNESFTHEYLMQRGTCEGETTSTRKAMTLLPMNRTGRYFYVNVTAGNLLSVKQYREEHMFHEGPFYGWVLSFGMKPEESTPFIEDIREEVTAWVIEHCQKEIQELRDRSAPPEILEAVTQIKDDIENIELTAMERVKTWLTRKKS